MSSEEALIPLFKANMSLQVSDKLSPILESGMVGEGPQVRMFTKALQSIFKHKNVIPLNSCTSALTLALRLANVDYGDRVLSSAFTMVATNCAIAASGADIVWAPCENTTLCMDLSKATEILEEQPDICAVVITLVGGVVPHNLDTFIQDCSRLGVIIIFDAAHALTTTYKGKHICHWADFTCFSFQSIKHLTTGDGGAIVVSETGAYMRAEKLKWFGMTREVPEGMSRLEHQMTYQMPEWGYKFHMNDIAACIGLTNLDVAAYAVEKSIDNANFYSDFMPNLRTLVPPNDCQPSWWVYPVWVNNPDKAVAQLGTQRIASSRMWPMNYIHKCFPDGEHPFADGMGSVNGGPIFIPNGFWVTEEDRERIAKAVCKVMND